MAIKASRDQIRSGKRDDTRIPVEQIGITPNSPSQEGNRINGLKHITSKCKIGGNIGINLFCLSHASSVIRQIEPEKMFSIIEEMKREVEKALEGHKERIEESIRKQMAYGANANQINSFVIDPRSFPFVCDLFNIDWKYNVVTPNTKIDITNNIQAAHDQLRNQSGYDEFSGGIFFEIPTSEGINNCVLQPAQEGEPIKIGRIEKPFLIPAISIPSQQRESSLFKNVTAELEKEIDVRLKKKTNILDRKTEAAIALASIKHSYPRSSSLSLSDKILKTFATSMLSDVATIISGAVHVKKSGPQIFVGSSEDQPLTERVNISDPSWMTSVASGKIFENDNSYQATPASLDDNSFYSGNLKHIKREDLKKQIRALDEEKLSSYIMRSRKSLDDLLPARAGDKYYEIVSKVNTEVLIGYNKWSRTVGENIKSILLGQDSSTANYTTDDKEKAKTMTNAQFVADNILRPSVMKVSTDSDNSVLLNITTKEATKEIGKKVKILYTDKYPLLKLSIGIGFKDWRTDITRADDPISVLSEDISVSGFFGIKEKGNDYRSSIEKIELLYPDYLQQDVGIMGYFKEIINDESRKEIIEKIKRHIRQTMGLMIQDVPESWGSSFRKMLNTFKDYPILSLFLGTEILHNPVRPERNKNLGIYAYLDLFTQDEIFGGEIYFGYEIDENEINAGSTDLNKVIKKGINGKEDIKSASIYSNECVVLDRQVGETLNIKDVEDEEYGVGPEVDYNLDINFVKSNSVLSEPKIESNQNTIIDVLQSFCSPSNTTGYDTSNSSIENREPSELEKMMISTKLISDIIMRNDNSGLLFEVLYGLSSPASIVRDMMSGKSWERKGALVANDLSFKILPTEEWENKHEELAIESREKLVNFCTQKLVEQLEIAKIEGYKESVNDTLTIRKYIRNNGDSAISNLDVENNREAIKEIVSSYIEVINDIFNENSSSFSSTILDEEDENEEITFELKQTTTNKEVQYAIALAIKESVEKMSSAAITDIYYLLFNLPSGPTDNFFDSINIPNSFFDGFFNPAVAASKLEIRIKTIIAVMYLWENATVEISTRLKEIREHLKTKQESKKAEFSLRLTDANSLTVLVKDLMAKEEEGKREDYEKIMNLFVKEINRSGEEINIPLCLVVKESDGVFRFVKSKEDLISFIENSYRDLEQGNEGETEIMIGENGEPLDERSSRFSRTQNSIIWNIENGNIRMLSMSIGEVEGTLGPYYPVSKYANFIRNNKEMMFLVEILIFMSQCKKELTRAKNRHQGFEKEEERNYTALLRNSVFQSWDISLFRGARINYVIPLKDLYSYKKVQSGTNGYETIPMYPLLLKPIPQMEDVYSGIASQILDISDIVSGNSNENFRMNLGLKAGNLWKMSNEPFGYRVIFENIKEVLDQEETFKRQFTPVESGDDTLPFYHGSIYEGEEKYKSIADAGKRFQDRIVQDNLVKIDTIESNCFEVKDEIKSKIEKLPPDLPSTPFYLDIDCNLLGIRPIISTTVKYPGGKFSYKLNISGIKASVHISFKAWRPITLMTYTNLIDKVEVNKNNGIEGELEKVVSNLSGAKKHEVFANYGKDSFDKYLREEKRGSRKVIASKRGEPEDYELVRVSTTSKGTANNKEEFVSNPDFFHVLCHSACGGVLNNNIVTNESDSVILSKVIDAINKSELVDISNNNFFKIALTGKVEPEIGHGFPLMFDSIFNQQGISIAEGFRRTKSGNLGKRINIGGLHPEDIYDLKPESVLFSPTNIGVSKRRALFTYVSFFSRMILRNVSRFIKEPGAKNPFAGWYICKTKVSKNNELFAGITIEVNSGPAKRRKFNNDPTIYVVVYVPDILQNDSETVNSIIVSKSGISAPLGTREPMKLFGTGGFLVNKMISSRDNIFYPEDTINLRSLQENNESFVDRYSKENLDNYLEYWDKLQVILEDLASQNKDAEFISVANGEFFTGTGEEKTLIDPRLSELLVKIEITENEKNNIEKESIIFLSKEVTNLYKIEKGNELYEMYFSPVYGYIRKVSISKNKKKGKSEAVNKTIDKALYNKYYRAFIAVDSIAMNSYGVLNREETIQNSAFTKHRNEQQRKTLAIELWSSNFFLGNSGRNDIGKYLTVNKNKLISLTYDFTDSEAKLADLFDDNGLIKKSKDLLNIGNTEDVAYGINHIVAAIAYLRFKRKAKDNFNNIKLKDLFEIKTKELCNSLSKVLRESHTGDETVRSLSSIVPVAAFDDENSIYGDRFILLPPSGNKYNKRVRIGFCGIKNSQVTNSELPEEVARSEELGFRRGFLYLLYSILNAKIFAGTDNTGIEINMEAIPLNPEQTDIPTEEGETTIGISIAEQYDWEDQVVEWSNAGI